VRLELDRGERGSAVRWSYSSMLGSALDAFPSRLFCQASLLFAHRPNNRYIPGKLRHVGKILRFRRILRQHRWNRFSMNRQRTGNGEVPDRGYRLAGRTIWGERP
jgi:hypothetical protein